MPGSVAVRQYADKRRTPAGEAFNDLVRVVVALNRHVTAAAEGLTRPSGQSLARWLVLEQAVTDAAPVAEIARRLHVARQSVQRVADVLCEDGLAEYVDNPKHRRAKLVSATRRGAAVLSEIDARQREWCDEMGRSLGRDRLVRLVRELEPVRDAMKSREARPARPG